MHKALLSAAEIDDFIIIRVHTLARKVQRAIIQKALEQDNLPVLEWQLLFSIARFGSCHLAHITNQTSIDPAHGSRAVASLEKKGLVERREDPTNRRRKVISLTPQGIETFNRIWPRARAVVQSVTQKLEANEFRDFKRLLASVNLAADTFSTAEPSNGLDRKKESEKITV